MSLDEISSLDSDESGGKSAESPSEKNEKQKESSRRAQAQLQKTQKDEKKAKGDNDILFHILTRFIQNPLYESLVDDIVELLQKGYPSRFLLAMIALVYTEAAEYMFRSAEKYDEHIRILHLPREKEKKIFQSTDIDPLLREWVSIWSTTSREFLTHEHASAILSKKLSNLLESENTRVSAEEGIAHIFLFFFEEKNISMTKEVGLSYAIFILREMRESLSERISHLDTDLTSESNIEEKDLFGI